MDRFLVKFFALVGVSFHLGCVPDEDTTPSTALFPTSHFGEIRPDFSGQLANHASREDVELHALLGVRYVNEDKKSLKPIQEALNQGYYANPSNGKTLYRVQSLAQAQQLLQGAWTTEKWTPDSNLGAKFATTPNASIVFLSQSDQRILFFNQANQLAEVYPKAG